jgi:hypothetical protein
MAFAVGANHWRRALFVEVPQRVNRLDARTGGEQRMDEGIRKE